MVDVEQVDRDAAADYAALCRDRFTLSDIEAMRRGKCDEFQLIHAFARHRLGALTPAPAERSGWDFADKLMNWLNALDSSSMSAKDVRSSVYHWALDFRPQKPVMRPKDRESVQLLEAIKAELFVLNLAVSAFIANIDENELEVGETIDDLRAAEKQASDFLMSLPLPSPPGDVE